MVDYNSRATGTGSGGGIALLVIGGLALVILLLALFAGGPNPEGMAAPVDGAVIEGAAPDAIPAAPTDGAAPTITE
jgi:hypothetical protein